MKWDRSRRASSSRLTWWAFAVATLEACSLAFPADQAQCASDSDCTERGGAFAGSVCIASACVSPMTKEPHADAGLDARVAETGDAERGALGDGAADAKSKTPDATVPPKDSAPPENDWSCLGRVVYPDASSATVSLALQYTNFLGLEPITGLRAQACLRVDPDCSNPVVEAGLTDDAGTVTFLLPSGYDGYIRTHWDASVTDLVYIDPPVFATTIFPEQSQPSSSALSQLAGAVGEVDGSTVSVDPADGLVFVGARDCKNKLAAGVTFNLAPPGDAIQVYIRGGLPSLQSTSTDQGGGGAFINVPPGSVTLTATLAATGQQVGSIVGYVEANSISDFSLVPSP